MKTRIIKGVAICFMALTTVVGGNAQTTVKKTAPVGDRAKIEKTKVPAIVTETHYKEFPLATTTYESWYGYPAFDYENEWYGYDPYLFERERPEYYIVEFTKDKVSHKVIYSKAGKKIATHKKITSDLPTAVTSAINKSAYSSWKTAKEKEEIFRDTEMDKMKVYKVDVEKGKEKHELFYSSEGVLLKDRAVKP